MLFYWYLDKYPSILDISPNIFQYFISAFKLNYLVSPPRPPAQPHLIPNPTRSFDHNWDFPKAFWKESRRLLIAAVLSLTAGWSCQTICSISHGKQYKLIYGLPGWHSPVQRDWKPSSIYQLYGRRSEQRRPKIIVHIYLKVVGLKERKAAEHTHSIHCARHQYHQYCSTTSPSPGIFYLFMTKYIYRRRGIKLRRG